MRAAAWLASMCWRPHSDILDYVVSRYGKLSGIDLMHLSHAEDPWLLANRNRPAGGSVRIRNEWTRDYFR
jgi:uncharacterized phage-associated protein